MKNKIKTFISLYLPDVLILTGIFILSYSFFQFKTKGNIIFHSKTIIEWWKILGTMSIVLGLNLIIRKILKNNR